MSLATVCLDSHCTTHPIQYAIQIERGRIAHGHHAKPRVGMQAHHAVKASSATFLEEIPLAVHFGDVPSERHGHGPVLLIEYAMSVL